MLEKLRGMAVFATVVKHGSFSGAAKELNITTSAVSQQIRSLEMDLGVVLLYRSTRKLSLTEAGETLYKSAVDMVAAAEQGRYQMNQLRDDVLGNLRIATTSQIAHAYIMPALSEWLAQNEELSLQLVVRNGDIDVIDERVDMQIDLSESKEGVVLESVKQVLLASPAYLKKHSPIDVPVDLIQHSFVVMGDGALVSLVHKTNNNKVNIKVNTRLMTNSAELALNLAAEGHGVVQSNVLDAKSYLDNGQLVSVLNDYELPNLWLVAKSSVKDHLPVKVERCIDMLEKYFQTKSS